MSATFPPHADGSLHWQRNLYVCVFGSFTTIMAMTLLLPFLPLYVQQLGAASVESAVQWSGVAFGATFLAAGLVAPLWGRLADRYGRKPILIRASLGMAITMSLLGVVQTVWQLVAIRFLAGLVGGYASGAIVMIATQTPRHRTAWALGTHASGMMAGNLVGPLVGGLLPGLIGIRSTFFLAGGLIFCSFIMTTLFVKEERRMPDGAKGSPARARSSGWRDVPKLTPVIAMLASAMLLMFANMSIEPIITVYVSQLVQDQKNVTLVAGLVMSAAALGSVLAAPRVGRLADRIGATKVIVACLGLCGVLLIPQIFVTTGTQLVVLRFLMGLALGGLLPAITSVVRHSVPDSAAGYILGYATSAQYIGQVTGPLAGGFIAAHVGMHSVFAMTSVLMFMGAGFNAWVFLRRNGSTSSDAAP
ncbi:MULTISPECIES: MFS transporter [unclassified Caballeronia]|uniref:MFS transporter n=1 Tax=unclassified Caballeronia TaxID=2646786 RepID=UPI002864B3A0|nr:MULTISPECIES: MFS transporter [unclassified Caballeronia]MDR5775100.1 MFS transporter [Caballeronia sp. LZ002]MDR5850538.1 MFS transporter [Caballeronia sp. LZ003]